MKGLINCYYAIIRLIAIIIAATSLPHKRFLEIGKLQVYAILLYKRFQIK